MSWPHNSIADYLHTYYTYSWTLDLRVLSMVCCAGLAPTNQMQCDQANSWRRWTSLRWRCLNLRLAWVKRSSNASKMCAEKHCRPLSSWPEAKEWAELVKKLNCIGLVLKAFFETNELVIMRMSRICTLHRSISNGDCSEIYSLGQNAIDAIRCCNKQWVATDQQITKCSNIHTVAG